MATFTASTAFDYRNIAEFDDAYGDLSTTSTSSAITLNDGYVKFILTGTTSTTDANLTYSSNNGISGMLGSLTSYLGGAQAYTLSGLSYNMNNNYYDDGYTLDGKTIYGMTAEVAVMLIGNDSITGSAYADRLAGFAGNDTINGAGGNDVLEGWSGADVLNGGAGNDVLMGGAGKDFFVFNTALSASTNVDRIKDFVVVDDTIRLENAIFNNSALKALSTGATLTNGFFKASATGLAGDSNDYINYETDTGKLFYDADGNGSGAAVQIALLGTSLALTNADFVII